MTIERWKALELSFTAKEAVETIEDAVLDATFENAETGRKMIMPGFWNGGKQWNVRFAPPETGSWTVTLACSGKVNLGLHGASQTFECVPYTGTQEIYIHGFVKAEPDKRYFVYDDGTPFFYLGDTHWAMPNEELDDKGPHAANIETDSHFRYIIEKRLAQKFNVYQSEPIGHKYNIWDGIGEDDIPDFKRIDRYFQILADYGMVHANAQLIFPGEVKPLFFVDSFLYHVSRFWVARYAAYPVLWTLGQEIDRSFFNKNGMTPENNPYKQMCRIIYDLDPYRHPITGHQENAALCGASGGSKAACWGGMHESQPSSFLGMKEHTWWGVQWRPEVDRQHVVNIPKDYWYTGEGKVSVNYETRYDYLYTKNFGARANGWITYLSGMFGYGYGAADIWCYLSRYSFDQDTSDGVDNVTGWEKQMPWGIAIQMPTGDQMTYLYDFFNSFDWWKLVPDFDEGNAYKNTKETVFYTAAHDGNDVYVVYLYNRNRDCGGSLVNMDKAAKYRISLFDPQKNEYTVLEETYEPKDGTYTLESKPSNNDVVLFAQKL